MIDLPLLVTPVFDTEPQYRLGGVGEAGTRLLSGPPASAGAESRAHHESRFGPVDAWSCRDALRSMIRDSGLQGRGGGGFPLAKKLDTAILAPGEPLIVVNASESEPASRKDQALLAHRPHLVLDGAAAVAAVVGAHQVVVHLHRGSPVAGASLAAAIAQRRTAGRPDPRWQLSTGPDRYVAGEASAIAALLDGGEARPHFSAVPLAQRGPSGRPTVVNNAETMAHVGLMMHLGWREWWAGGSPSSPGSHLFTLVGGVDRPGHVVEVVGRASVGELLAHAGVVVPPEAVLMGGYAGSWVEGAAAWQATLDREGLAAAGAQLGCGLIGVLPQGACGLAETARVLSYLAGETAGQCGPCVHGLPRLSRAFTALAQGGMRRRGLRQLWNLSETIDGSGACSHPDGAVRLVQSALTAFETDVAVHLAGRPCPGAGGPPVLSVPAASLSEREWR